HGALWFRGFPMHTLEDFERFTKSVFHELYGGYGDLPRAGASRDIYKSTPYPEDKMILFHSESSHLSSWPMRICFFCLEKSPVGGETPIVDNRRMYQALGPAIRRRFEEKKL